MVEAISDVGRCQPILIELINTLQERIPVLVLRGCLDPLFLGGGRRLLKSMLCLRLLVDSL